MGGGGRTIRRLGRSRGGFTTKIPCQIRCIGSHDRVRPDRRRGKPTRRTSPSSSTSDRTSRPRAAIGDKGYASKANRARRTSQRHRPRSFPTRPTRRRSPRSSQSSSTRLAPPPRIEQGIWRSQTLQAGRPSVREDGPQLSIHRQLRSRTMLDQIRPHGLATDGPQTAPR